MVEELVAEAQRLASEGLEARLAAADPNAQSEADADRSALFQLRGTDVNQSEEKIARIRRRVGEEAETQD